MPTIDDLLKRVRVEERFTLKIGDCSEIEADELAHEMQLALGNEYNVTLNDERTKLKCVGE